MIISNLAKFDVALTQAIVVRFQKMLNAMSLLRGITYSHPGVPNRAPPMGTDISDTCVILPFLSTWRKRQILKSYVRSIRKIMTISTVRSRKVLREMGEMYKRKVMVFAPYPHLPVYTPKVVPNQ